jgi:hypothetical protein
MTNLLCLQGEGPLTEHQARELTWFIKNKADELWEMIKQAYLRRAWDALGYQSWDDYCTREFGTARLRLPQEERAEVVASLRESGLSLRAIESATGISRPTIIKDLLSSEVVNSLPPRPDVDADDLAEEPIATNPPGGVTDGTPGQTGRVAEALAKARDTAPRPITGLDGKRYPPKPSGADQKPRRNPITDQFGSAVSDLTRVTNRIARLGADDRFDKNREALGMRASDITRAIQALIPVLAQLRPDQIKVIDDFTLDFLPGFPVDEEECE